MYRVNLVVVNLGWVDFGHSTTCPVMFGQIGIWQSRLSSWAKWWNFEIKVNSTQVHNHRAHPYVSPRQFSAQKYADSCSC